jgi:dTDP-4-amino-4,6-dideoxygalactose transaminase
MVLTNDDSFYKKLLMLRVHGMEPKYFHKLIGGNFRLDSLQAAVLSVKLRYLEAWNAARRRNAALYRGFLEGRKEIRLPAEKEGFRHVYNQFVVRIPSRDKTASKLREAGIGHEIYYPLPLHLQECFSYLGHKSGDFPVAESAAREVLALPVFPELTEAEIELVASELIQAV